MDSFVGHPSERLRLAEIGGLAWPGHYGVVNCLVVCRNLAFGSLFSFCVQWQLGGVALVSLLRCLLVRVGHQRVNFVPLAKPNVRGCLLRPRLDF